MHLSGTISAAKNVHHNCRTPNRFNQVLHLDKLYHLSQFNPPTDLPSVLTASLHELAPFTEVAK